MCKELAGHLRGPGPEPECSDSELIANCLIGECLGWDVETVLLSHMQAHRESHPPAHQIAQNQKKQIPAFVSRLYDAVRQIIETVTSQLESQFSIETNRAHTLRGLCARLYTKLTAHTLCIHINRLLGVPDYLQIKQLAFPNEHKAPIDS